MRTPSAGRRRATRVIVCAATVACTALVPGTASAANTQAIADHITGAGAPGAIVNDNNTDIATSGYADIATNRPIRPWHRFRAGSLTKTFTATVALKLVAADQLELEDTVEDHLPGLLPYGDQVTIEMLLQHTSGAPDYWESNLALLYQFVENPVLREQTWTPAAIVDLIDEQAPDFTPGTSIYYSNTNYVILGIIIEEITGHSLSAEIALRITAPLGLHNTFMPTTQRKLGVLPISYTRGTTAPLDEEGEQAGPLQDMTEYNPSILWGMGAVVSNARDLNRFYKALLGNQLLPASLVNRMVGDDPQHPAIPFQGEGWIPGVSFGLGIWKYDLPCGKTVYGHEGEVPGYNTWTFANRSGTRSITLEVPELLIPSSLYYDVVAPDYIELWCE